MGHLYHQRTCNATRNTSAGCQLLSLLYRSITVISGGDMKPFIEKIQYPVVLIVSGLLVIAYTYTED